ncbi:MAG: hypothetical protein A2X49_03405 [Lentisphaerae bacterium GWF2_52_8]|nr:MAG: hypothetical protein A2X49_03405 [Lentisphaerae bacterium GWF2_52_8]
MKDIEKQGIVNKRDTNAWEVRHKKAHGEKIGVGQAQIDSHHKLIILLNHLIFNLIGYKGKYTDYGEHGFPIKEYPHN